MKPLSLPWAALVLSGVMLGQTAKQPEKAASPAPVDVTPTQGWITSDLNGVVWQYYRFTTTTSQCHDGAPYDAILKACHLLTFQYAGPRPVHCSQVRYGGSFYMDCWYKPIPKPATKEKP